MSAKFPDCQVHQLGEMQPSLRANDWRSPLVLRVSASDIYKDGEKSIQVDYRRNGKSERKQMLLVWEGLASDFALCVNTYQAPVLTEFASLGLACALMKLLPKLQITEVTRRGEVVDYWVGKNYLIEISGQQAGDLDALRDQKADQLKKNPFGLPGFVCVVSFDTRNSYLWFYKVTK